MAEMSIKEFPYDTESQMTAYFDTLHNDTKDGRFVVTFGKGCHHTLNGKPTRVKQDFMEHFKDYQSENIFCTINAFNKFKNLDKPERNQKNLYCFDTLLFDIDAITEGIHDRNLEPQLVTEFLEYCKMKQIPVPNAFSYTGSGGVHLYYKIAPVYPRLNKALQALKYIMAEKMTEFLRTYEDGFGIEYKVDTQVFDDMRLDRMPGTMNPKTGRMCEFFVIDGVERYTFKQLLGYTGNENDIDWNNLAKRAKENYYYGKGKHTKIILSQFRLDKKKTRKPTTTGKKSTHWVPMSKKRVEGFFVLAENGYDFKHCRESACFMLRQFCRHAGYSTKEELEYLYKLNECFWEPLDEYSLLHQTNSRGLYRISNATIAEKLHLDVEDELFKKAFGVKKDLRIREYGFTQKRLTRAKCYIAVCKYLMKHDNALIREISEETGYTRDQVATTTMVLNKRPEYIPLWAKTTLDDYDFITDFLEKYDKRSAKNKKKTVSSPKNDEKKHIYKKIDIKGMMPEEILIPEGIMNMPITKDTVTHECEKLMGRAVMLINKAKNVKTWDSRKNRAQGLFLECQRWGYVLISTEGVSALHTAYKFFTEALGIPRYWSEHITRGYWRYSQTYITAHLEHIFECSGDLTCPNAHASPMYEGQILPFPEKNKDDTFYYSPNTILKHYFKIYDVHTYEEILPIPELYYDCYGDMRKLKDAYSYQKEWYKKNSDKWNVSEANKCVSLANQILAEMNDLYEYYYKELAKVQEEFPEYKGFDAEGITRKLRRDFYTKHLTSLACGA